MRIIIQLPMKTSSRRRSRLSGGGVRTGFTAAPSTLWLKWAGSESRRGGGCSVFVTKALPQQCPPPGTATPSTTNLSVVGCTNRLQESGSERCTWTIALDPNVGRAIAGGETHLVGPDRPPRLFAKVNEELVVDSHATLLGVTIDLHHP